MSTEGRPASFPADQRGVTLPAMAFTAPWPQGRLLKRHAPSWTGSQRQLFSLLIYITKCVIADGGPDARLTAQQRADARTLIGIRLLPNGGAQLVEGGLARAVANPPINRAGAMNLPGGGSCWYYAVPSRGIAARWVAGGGEMGPIVDNVFGPPPDVPGLPTAEDPVTGNKTWLGWSIEDLLGFIGLDPLGCKGYFAGLRLKFTQLGRLVAPLRCGEAAASVVVPRPEAPLHTTPPRQFPWGWVIVGLLAYGGAQTAIAYSAGRRSGKKAQE
jgi:hypothetical protein